MEEFQEHFSFKVPERPLRIVTDYSLVPVKGKTPWVLGTPMSNRWRRSRTGTGSTQVLGDKCTSILKFSCKFRRRSSTELISNYHVLRKRIPDHSSSPWTYTEANPTGRRDLTGRLGTGRSVEVVKEVPDPREFRVTGGLGRESTKRQSPVCSSV